MHERTQISYLDPGLEREISSVEIADFVRENWCYEAEHTLDVADTAINELLEKLCVKVGLDREAITNADL